MRGRPKKPRNIKNEPFIRRFSPRGHKGRPGYTDIGLDGYEAMRLTDFIGLGQKEAAASMGISPQTYSRVLKKARKALTEGIVLGRMIRITKTAKESHKTKEKGQRTRKNPTLKRSIYKPI